MQVGLVRPGYLIEIEVIGVISTRSQALISFSVGCRPLISICGRRRYSAAGIREASARGTDFEMTATTTRSARHLTFKKPVGVVSSPAELGA